MIPILVFTNHHSVRSTGDTTQSYQYKHSYTIPTPSRRNWTTQSAAKFSHNGILFKCWLTMISYALRRVDWPFLNQLSYWTDNGYFKSPNHFALDILLISVRNTAIKFPSRSFETVSAAHILTKMQGTTCHVARLWETRPPFWSISRIALAAPRKRPCSSKPAPIEIHGVWEFSILWYCNIS